MRFRQEEDVKIAGSKKRALEYVILALILMLGTVLNCYKIAEPAWDTTHPTHYGGAVDGWNGFYLCEWGGIARSYYKFGFFKGGPGQVAYRRQLNPSLFHHRIDHPHPPLLLLLGSLSFHLFGVHEWSARLVVLLSSTGLLLLVFWLGREIGGTKIALTASFFFALLPLQVHYGTLFFQHTLAAFFSFLTFAFYWWWVEKRRTGYYVGIYISFVLGALSEWGAYFVVPPILLHYLVCEYKKTKNRNFVIFFALMPFVLFGIHLGWTYVLGGKWALEGLLDRFLIRTVSGGSVEGKALFTLWDFYTFGYIRARLFLTPIICFLSVAWFASCMVTSLQKLSRQDLLLLALFLFGLSHNLVFSNVVYYHDVVMFLYFTLPFAIAAALGAQFIIHKVLRKKWVWAVPFALTVCYLFGTQSASALEWLFDVPVLPETYILGSRVHEITDEGAKVTSSFEPEYRMLYYADREWSVARDLNSVMRLLEEDGGPSLYILDSKSAESVSRELREYLARDHPMENFYNYSFFDLRTSGSNVIVRNPHIEHPTGINFDDKLMFLGYNVEETVHKKKDPLWLEKYLKGHAELLPEHRTFFRITYFWQCLEETEEDYTLVTQFDGYHGKTYRIDQSHQGVNGVYPTAMWNEGKVIKEEYQIEVPADYPPLRYALWVGVRDGEEKLEVVNDVETDEENRVRLGEIEVLPAERPTPLAEPQPQNRVEANINDELAFLGYDLSKRDPKPGDQLKVTTYWQNLRGTERDYTIQVELRNGGYKVREILDIASTRLWEEGRYYRGDAVIAINPHLLGGTYSLSLGLERDDETGTQISLASLDIPSQRRHIIKRVGKANYGGSHILNTEEPLSLQFALEEREALELAAGWTGKSEFEETRVEVYITNAYWREKYLGTWTVESGNYRVTRRKIGKVSTAPGENVIELRVPEMREKERYIGWRRVLDLLFPDFFQDISLAPYDGAIQMDFAQVSTRWEEGWNDYYDLAEVYAERWMMDEVARLYEKAVEEGLEPARVDDYALFRGAYKALGEEARIREIEERIAARIPYKMNVNLGRKVEFLGYNLGITEDGHGLGLFFKCLDEMQEDYTLWVHGEVEDESLLKGQRREAGYAVFDHLLPTLKWRVGEVYQDDEVRGLKPGRYHFTLGLWRPEDGSRLWKEDNPEEHLIDLGWVEVK